MTEPAPRLLYVATVALTVRYFLVPLAAPFRKEGWFVSAAARGALEDPVVRGSFDAVQDLPLSRSILDVAGIVRGYRTVSRIVGDGQDLIHVHSPIAAMLVRLAVRSIPPAKRPAVVYTAHGFHFHRGGRRVTNLMFSLAERVAGRWTDRLIVINDEDEGAARRLRIVPPDRLVRMSGIGVDGERFSRAVVASQEVDAVRRDLGLAPSAPLFVVVAELTRRKRNADVVRALAAMRRADAVLAIAGEGPERDRIERLVARLGLGPRVRLLGQVDDVRPLVVAARAMVLASDREGLSRALMESLALEVPVIASTARGNREVTGENGRIVPIGDVEALAATMDWFADHEEDARLMGRLGRARIVHEYGLAEILRQHRELYVALLRRRRGEDQVARPDSASRAGADGAGS